jgi:hypothetical protein
LFPVDSIAQNNIAQCYTGFIYLMAFYNLGERQFEGAELSDFLPIITPKYYRVALLPDIMVIKNSHPGTYDIINYNTFYTLYSALG